MGRGKWESAALAFGLFPDPRSDKSFTLLDFLASAIADEPGHDPDPHLSTRAVDAMRRERAPDFHLPGEVIGLDSIDTRCHATTAVALDTVSLCRVPLRSLVVAAVRAPSLQARLLRLRSQQLARAACLEPVSRGGAAGGIPYTPGRPLRQSRVAGIWPRTPSGFLQWERAGASPSSGTPKYPGPDG